MLVYSICKYNILIYYSSGTFCYSCLFINERIKAKSKYDVKKMCCAQRVIIFLSISIQDYNFSVYQY